MTVAPLNPMAYLNHGRWVVDCSADDCEAVLFADRTICECRDVSVCEHSNVPCGVPLRVVFPTDRVGIDRLLGSRPRRNRNWIPSETVNELKTENLLHGVGI